MQLRTRSGKVPSLFLTEFGYWNQPRTGRPSPIKRPPSREAFLTWHSESEKAAWLPSALSVAERNKAKTFVFWLLVEGDKDGVRQDFDTGVLGGPAADLTKASFDVDGARPFSKPDLLQNPSNKPTYRYIEPGAKRTAYCAIQKWAIDDMQPVTKHAGSALTTPGW